MVQRQRFEMEYRNLYRDIGMGTTTWQEKKKNKEKFASLLCLPSFSFFLSFFLSAILIFLFPSLVAGTGRSPLASGVLTGKYGHKDIPDNSRFHVESYAWVR